MAAKFNTVGEFVTIRGIKLNITLRDAPGCEFMAEGDNPLSVIKPMSLVVYHTVVAWFAVKKALKTDDTKALAELKTPEASAEFDPTNTDPDKGALPDPLCTVWGKFKGASITVVSSQPPINAYRVAKAWRAAVVMLEGATNGNGSKAEENQPEPEEKPNLFTDTKPDVEKPAALVSPVTQVLQQQVDRGQHIDPNMAAIHNIEQPFTAKGLPDGVIWANERLDYDNLKVVQYEHGQGVAYSVSSIELTETQTDKPCIKLVSPQGKHTIFCRDFKGEKRSPDFANLVKGAGKFIEDKYVEYKEHGDKFTRDGKWIIIMKIHHAEKDGTINEYRNVVELREAEADNHPF